MLANDIKQAISGSGTGNLTLGSASSAEHLTVAAHFSDGDLFYYTLEESGVGVERGIGTTSSGALVRSTPLETVVSSVLDNTSPTPLNFTSSAILTVSAISQAFTQHGYFTVAQSVTTANVAALPGRHYELTIAGLTANRNFVLPVPTEIGQQIRVKIVDGNATDELLLVGDTTVTINGGSPASEWSRLFIAGEVVEFRSTSATNWDVVHDGRIPCSASMGDSNLTTWNASTATTPNYDTVNYDNAGIVNLTNDRFDIRRTGLYRFELAAVSNNSPTQTAGCNAGIVSLFKDGVSFFSSRQPAAIASNRIGFLLTASKVLVAGSFYTPVFQHEEASTTFNANPDTTYAAALEIFE